MPRWFKLNFEVTQEATPNGLIYRWDLIDDVYLYLKDDLKYTVKISDAFNIDINGEKLMYQKLSIVPFSVLKNMRQVIKKWDDGSPVKKIGVLKDVYYDVSDAIHYLVKFNFLPNSKLYLRGTDTAINLNKAKFQLWNEYRAEKNQELRVDSVVKLKNGSFIRIIEIIDKKIFGISLKYEDKQFKLIHKSKLFSAGEVIGEVDLVLTGLSDKVVLKD